MQLCDSPRLVTVSIDKCFFEKPAKEGQLIKIYGSPSKLGNTSVTLYMEAGNPVPIGEKGRSRIQKLIDIRDSEQNDVNP